MTNRVTRKLFRNGGSWALRIPAGWLLEEAEYELVRREDGVLEVHPMDNEMQFKEFLKHLAEQGELPDSETWIPQRLPEPDRWNLDELFGKNPK
jgi:virulence-associated protein VagC